MPGGAPIRKSSRKPISTPRGPTFRTNIRPVTNPGIVKYPALYRQPDSCPQSDQRTFLQHDLPAMGAHDIALDVPAELTLPLRADAARRAITNLVDNARRHARHVVLAAVAQGSRGVQVTVDDDGPGIPLDMREDVFRPFLRLDDARNQDEGGTGLGLAIARDIARSHGGDITLGDSPLGGLRATVRVPV